MFRFVSTITPHPFEFRVEEMPSGSQNNQPRLLTLFIISTKILSVLSHLSLLL